MKYLFFYFLFLIPVSTKAAPKDLSVPFAELYAQEDAQSLIEKLPEQFDKKIHSYFFLIVPGILSDYLDYTIGRIDRETENKFMNFLTKHGLQENIDFQKLSLKEGYSGEASPELNRQAIIKAIQDAKKPVLLFTHSKASVDTLLTLLEFPALQNKVAGWVASQSPFHGSPIADQVCAHPVEGFPADLLFEFFAGNSLGLQSLQQNVRVQFMLHHVEEIKKLTKKIPTISFASYVMENELNGWMGIVDGLYGQEMNRLFHNQHDGLVQVPSTELAGADFAIYDGLNHLSDNRREKPYTALSILLLQKLGVITPVVSQP